MDTEQIPCSLLLKTCMRGAPACSAVLRVALGRPQIGGCRERACRDSAWRALQVATPDVREEALQAGDEAMILASDGLWDVLSNQDAVSMIRDIPVRAPCAD